MYIIECERGIEKSNNIYVEMFEQESTCLEPRHTSYEIYHSLQYRQNLLGVHSHVHLRVTRNSAEHFAAITYLQ